MPATVVTISGAIGTRRSEIATALAERLGWKRVKFSDYIKAVLNEQEADAGDRRLQQKVGQDLVQADARGFVENVLALVEGWTPEQNLVVDGLRHVEMRLALQNAIEPADLFYVHVEIDEVTRQEIAETARGIQERLLYRYDQDLTEAQLPKILPAYADIIVDGSLPQTHIVDQIVNRLRKLGKLD